MAETIFETFRPPPVSISGKVLSMGTLVNNIRQKYFFRNFVSTFPVFPTHLEIKLPNMEKKLALILLSSVLFLLISPRIFCQKLDDFKQAATERGVESIPFSSLKSDARDIQGDINSCKSTLASFEDWATYDRKKRKDYTAIRLENDIVKKRQDYIKSLKEKNVDASEFEKELETNFKTIKDYNDDIAAINYQISKAIDAWDIMIRLRAKIAVKYKDVLEALSNAKSSPNQFLGDNPTEEDRNKLLEYIETIQKTIEAGRIGHATEETEAVSAKNNMKEVLERSSE
jgi:hypothetical protein